MKDKLKKLTENKKNLITAIIICVVVIVAIVLFVTKPWQNRMPDQAELLSEWETEAAVQNNRFAGVVESSDAWTISQEEGGVVKEFLVEEGQTVKKGTPLLTYDIESFETELAEREIELARLQNEYESTEATIAELKKEKGSASSGEQANYTIQIQEEELALKQGKIDIDSKQAEIDKLKKVIENATVKSKVNGVVRTINKGNNGSDFESEEGGDVLIAISQTEDLRVKGTLNELNIKDIQEGMQVIVHSRRDESTWKGVVEKVEIDNAEQSQQEEEYYYDEGTESGSTDYPFYVKLDSSEGLMIGQHVYIEAAGE